MLFDARPNVIRTFGLRIKQFLTAFNISFSDILETPSYFVLPPWYIRPPKIVLDLMHLNIVQMRLFIRSFSWKCKRVTVIIFLFIQMVLGMGSMWLVLQIFHRTP